MRDAVRWSASNIHCSLSLNCFGWLRLSLDEHVEGRYEVSAKAGRGERGMQL